MSMWFFTAKPCEHCGVTDALRNTPVGLLCGSCNDKLHQYFIEHAKHVSDLAAYDSFTCCGAETMKKMLLLLFENPYRISDEDFLLLAEHTPLLRNTLRKLQEGFVMVERSRELRDERQKMRGKTTDELIAQKEHLKLLLSSMNDEGWKRHLAIVEEVLAER